MIIELLSLDHLSFYHNLNFTHLLSREIDGLSNSFGAPNALVFK